MTGPRVAVVRGELLGDLVGPPEALARPGQVAAPQAQVAGVDRDVAFGVEVTGRCCGVHRSGVRRIEVRTDGGHQHPGAVQPGQRGEVPGPLCQLDPGRQQGERLGATVDQGEPARQVPVRHRLGVVVVAVDQGQRLLGQGGCGRPVTREPTFVLECLHRLRFLERVAPVASQLASLGRERHPEPQIGSGQDRRGRLEQQVEPLLGRRGDQRQHPLVPPGGIVQREAGGRPPSRPQPVLDRGRHVTGRTEMVGQLGRPGIQVVVVHRHDRLGEPAPGPLPVGSRQLVGQRLAGQRMPEPVPRQAALVPLGEQLQPEPVPDGVVGQLGGQSGGERQHRDVQPFPGDRRELEQLQRGDVQVAGAGEQRLADRQRHLDRGQVASYPVAGLGVDVAAFDEDLRELLDEKRVPAGAFQDGVGELVADVGAVEDRAQHATGVVLVERVEPDLDVPTFPAQLGEDPCQRMPPVQLVPSVGADDQHRQVAELPRQVAEQPQAVDVCPVQILQQQQRPGRSAQPVEQLPHREVQVLRPRRRGWERHGLRDLRQQGGGQHRRTAEQRSELRVVEGADPAPDRGDERPVRDPRLGGALPREPAEPALLGQPEGFGGESRLADPGLAGDEDHRPGPGGQQLVATLREQGGLTLPSDLDGAQGRRREHQASVAQVTLRGGPA